MQLSNYSKVHQAYHREAYKMKGHRVVVQEKVDGSQISFKQDDGDLFVKSKNKMVNPESPHTFGLAVEGIERAKMPETFVFRAEYLSKPRHNTLQYDRVPVKNSIVYDIEKTDGSREYLTPSQVREACDRVGFETVPTLWEGDFDDITPVMIKEWLKTESILGGIPVEGVVIKCYDLLDSNGHVLMVKHVRPEFKEMNGGKAGRIQSDVVMDIAACLETDARFDKAIQAGVDAGILIGMPEDIGPLMKILNEDFEEHTDLIKGMLYAHYRKSILRMANRGFADYYKSILHEPATWGFTTDGGVL